MAIYYHDIRRVKERVSSIQSSIKEMDQTLKSGSTVLDDMNQIRTEFLDNKKASIIKKSLWRSINESARRDKKLSREDGHQVQ